jgi:hypothetical protein
VLSLEPEPRAIAEHFFDVVAMVVIGGGPRAVGSPDLAPFERHVGLCVDACHAAVEFEDLSQNIELIRTFRAGIGKLQFTSAVCVRDPVSNRQGVAALLALDEPRYLHQVTGQGPDAVARVGDLPELAQALQHERSPWWRCAEWRCHFHVPVDIESFDGTGLSTTREYANGALAIALVEPAKWRTNELHVEIETYTWDVLPRAARGAGELVDGLEREYRHVIGELDKSGWKHASS